MSFALQKIPTLAVQMSRITAQGKSWFRERHSWRTAAIKAMETAEASELRSASQERFLQIVEKHGNIISRLCYAYAPTAADFEDLRQDCLVNIWKGLDRFDCKSSMATWIYRVCINTCISDYRVRKRRGAQTPLEMVADMPVADDRDQRENMELLYDAISTLNVVDRGIITMWLDDMPYEDIARVTGLSKSNVAVRIHRIKGRIRQTADKV